MLNALSVLRSADLEAEERMQLRRIEQKLDLIMAHLGVTYDLQLPESVRRLADNGEKIGAIRAYRDATGASLVEAKSTVEAYLRQRSQ